MLAQIAERIVAWQIKKGTLEETERTVYQYAYELLINQMINILFAVLIAIVFKSPVTVLLFLLSYIPLRSFCGGFHADTNLGCTIVSAMILCCVCLVTNYVQESWLLNRYPIAFGISGYFIIRYAPVPDRNKPLDEIETVRYGNRSRILWGAETIIGILLYLTWRKYGMAVAISHIVLSVMLGLGLVKSNKNNISKSNA